MKEILHVTWELITALWAVLIAYLFSFALGALVFAPALLIWWLS